MTPLTPDEARDQLATADTLATTSGAAAQSGAFTTAAVGLLVGSVLAMSRAFAGTNKVAFATGMAIYVLGIGAVSLWHWRRFRVASRGWSRRYYLSGGLTMALYVIGVGWATTLSPTWTLFAPYCVLTALPMVIAAVRSARQ